MDYTVGELAKRAGLTVRTLHHYEELGLHVKSMIRERGHPGCVWASIGWHG